MVHIIMCACDDDFSGGIGHDELNSDVCMAITQYEVSQEDFGHCDTNDDGEIDLDEALAAIEKYQNELTGRALTAFNRDNFFSNDAHVEAVVRVMGCVCDQDGSWTLGWMKSAALIAKIFKISFSETLAMKNVFILLMGMVILMDMNLPMLLKYIGE